MKIGAVALLRIAGLQHIAVSPSGSRLVILHGGENVVVNGAGFIREAKSFPLLLSLPGPPVIP